MLKNDFKFQRVCIPLNPRNSKTANSSFDEFGTPICPLDGTPFTFIGKSKGKNRSLRFKYVCHKSLPKGSTRVCCCETPCTTSKYGRCCYTYPDKDFRLYPGIPRNTEHFANLYRHRLNVERSINQFKNIFGLQKPRSHNSKTLKADLFLAGITQLIGVILADALFKKNIAENIPNKKHLFKSIRTVINKVA